jgi:hypothetical protein
MRQPNGHRQIYALRLFGLASLFGASITTVLFLVIKGRVHFFANGAFLFQIKHSSTSQLENGSVKPFPK